MVAGDCFNSKGFLNVGPRRLFRLLLPALGRDFYLDTGRTGRWFSHYVHEFKTVELNSPFHK